MDSVKDSIPFEVGDLVTYHDHTNGMIHDGDITFITNDYIVVCIHRELKSEGEQQGARSPYREVKILVFRSYWKQLIPRTK